MPLPADGGKTWEGNWITDRTPVSDEPGKVHGAGIELAAKPVAPPVLL